MKFLKTWIVASFAFFATGLDAQTPYFQQQVDYTIRVRLDDQKHELEGTISMVYHNNAPTALTELYLHLWPNAYKNRNTAFCRQQLEQGNAKFYFAPDSSLGRIKNLDIEINGIKYPSKTNPDNPDILLIALSEPLQPGDSLRLSTPFLVELPSSFSRLGHVGTSYQITQWFPKPAVYDRKGWHAMPYLDQGEFFSEFGNFDVEITLPDNYVVGATGVLLTTSEQVFLDEKEKETRAWLDKKEKGNDDFPASTNTFKTLKFKAENVHDFAWFADKRFMVLRDTAVLENGEKIQCTGMFTPSDAKLWTQGAFYVRRSVEFYSKNVGPYPWPQATAVHSALSAGGGMEYPMITVIGNSGSARSLDEVITHEVGHNWFYGILASNERDHPWMDEGINTYYEQRYMNTYYESQELIEVPKFIYDKDKNGPLLDIGYRMLARNGRAMPPDTRSDKLTSIGYGLLVYMKPALAARWLETSAGTEAFDAAMKYYYQKWKFKHPYPEDMELAWLEQGLQAPWFFESMKTRKQAEFKLKNVEKTDGGIYQLHISSKGDLQAPVSVSAMRDGKALDTLWLPPFQSDTAIVVQAPEGTDAFLLDAGCSTLDLNRKNNLRRTTGLFPGLEPLKVQPIAPFQNNRRTTVGILPWAGWNNYDKAMLGVVLYSPPVPSPRWSYNLLPGYAFGSKQFVGLGEVFYRATPGGFAERLTVGVTGKTFDFDRNDTEGYYRKFYRLVPQVRLDLKSASNSYRQSVQWRTLFMGKENANFDTLGSYSGKAYLKSTIHELKYMGAQKKLTNPFTFAATLEFQQHDNVQGGTEQYLRSSLEWRQQFYYSSKRKVTARFFAGYFLENTRRNSGTVSNDLSRASFALNPQGFNDYRFDEHYLGRSEDEGFLSRQVAQTEGGFKSAFGAPFAGVIGNSNSGIVSLNLRADLPFRLPLGIPLKPYFDLGYYNDATPLSETVAVEQFLWSGGFLLEFFDGMMEVYFPLVNSQALRDRYIETGGGTDDGALFGGGNYFKWISWSFNLKGAHPQSLLDNNLR